MSGLSSYIDIPNKTIHLVGEVNEDMYLTVQRGIGRLAEDPREMCYTLNTEGGDFLHGLAIHDLIRYFTPESKMVVFGSCMSSGMVILQAAKKRIATPHTEFMVHFGESSVESNQAGIGKPRYFPVTKNIRHWFSSQRPLFETCVRYQNPLPNRSKIAQLVLWEPAHSIAFFSRASRSSAKISIPYPGFSR